MSTPLAMVLIVLALAAALYAVFGDDPVESIYDEDDVDPRARPDPWSDTQ